MYTVILTTNENIQRKMTVRTIEAAENLVKIAAKSGHYKEAIVVKSRTKLN
jgi:tRNA(Phe) wybutosine-synthesizing methylase Tyw3